MVNQKSLNNNADRCSSYKTKIIKLTFIILFINSLFKNLVALLCYKSEFCIFTKETYNKSEKKLNFVYHRGQVVVLV